MIKGESLDAKNLLIFVGMIAVANIFTWGQMYGQFIWKSFASHLWLLSAVGIFSSFMFIKGAQFAGYAFNGQVWPIRIFTFTIGTIVFAILTALFKHETPDAKTLICLLLSFVIIFIQVYL